MDGFFDKYGRVIIIAVAICFVLLYLTPMRNVVGSSINGFAGNFADKVGESLGTVKMPDGSDNVVKEKSSMIIGTVWDGSEYTAPDTQFANTIPEQATSVVFTDEVAPKGITTTDLTVVKDGDVVGWLDGTTWKVSTQNPNKVVTFNENCAYMFVNLRGNHEFHNLTNISFENVDTSNVKNMSGMFYADNSLNVLDLSTFDTTNVDNMESMFGECVSLMSLNLNSFSTSNITSMRGMFRGCIYLTSLNLSSFDTSNVTDMAQMFDGCSSLETVKAHSQTDINNFKTKNTDVNSSVKFIIS